MNLEMNLKPVWHSMTANSRCRENVAKNVIEAGNATAMTVAVEVGKGSGVEKAVEIEIKIIIEIGVAVGAEKDVH